MDFYQNTQPEAQTETPNAPDQPTPDGAMPEQPSTETPPQEHTPSYPGGGTPPNQSGQPYQNSQPYGSGRQPYQNNQTYGNGMPPYGNNGYQQNEYPYYNRNAYQLPPKEPGSGLAATAMVLGIISIVSCFTFTVYPAFVTGSIAIVLALLSKGRQAKLLTKARSGIICGIAGLIINTVLVISCIVLLYTNPDVRAEVNKTFEKQYGMSFDEMMEEIMEENGFSQ